jgi:hypothetical protein
MGHHGSDGYWVAVMGWGGVGGVFFFFLPALKGVRGVVFYFCWEVKFASLCAKKKKH